MADGRDFKVRGMPKRRLLPKPRTLVTIAIVVAVAVVAWRQRSAIADVAVAMSQGALMPLIAAGFFESCRIIFHAFAYTRSFKTVGYDVPLRSTIPAWFKAVFMNTILPSGGTSGLAAVIDTARSHGVPVGSATTGTIFTQTCFYVAMMIVIVFGWFVMGRSGSLHARDVLVGSVVGIAALAFTTLLALGHLKPGLLQRIMRRVERLVSRLCKKVHLKEPKPWADNLVHSFSSAATELSRHPKRASTVLASMVVAMAFDSLAFIASGFAFGITALDALFGGYVTALVFNSFNVTPGGVGIVEGLAAAVLAGYGFPGTLAISAVLTYRAFMYWIPFGIGGVAMRLTKAFGTEKGEASETSGASEKGGAAAEKQAPPEGVAAFAAAAAERMAAASNEGPVYVQRRKSRVPLRDRVLRFARNSIESRTVLCALAVAATAVMGVFSAAFPLDSAMALVLVNYMNLDAPLPPAWLAVASYLLLLTVPGILIHDQGNWILGIVGLLFLGIMTGLTAHGIAGMIMVVISLAMLVKWHACFTEHAFLRSIPRLTVVLIYAVVLLILFILLGAVAARESITPDPGYLGTVWLGLQSLVTAPNAGFSIGGPAFWYFSSARALSVVLSVCVIIVATMVTVRRALQRRNPEFVEARARARAEAEAAAAERREVRRILRAERIARRRAQFAEVRATLATNTAELAEKARRAAVRGAIGVKDAVVAEARSIRADMAARRAEHRDEDVLDVEDVVVEEIVDVRGDGKAEGDERADGAERATLEDDACGDEGASEEDVASEPDGVGAAAEASEQDGASGAAGAGAR